MNDFEVRYNAMEQALLMIGQRLIVELAASKGADGAAWITQFRNAVTGEISDTRQMEEGRPPEITRMSRSIVEGICSMATHRYEQLKDEGRL